MAIRPHQRQCRGFSHWRNVVRNRHPGVIQPVRKPRLYTRTSPTLIHKFSRMSSVQLSDRWNPGPARCRYGRTRFGITTNSLSTARCSLPRRDRHGAARSRLHQTKARLSRNNPRLHVTHNSSPFPSPTKAWEPGTRPFPLCDNRSSSGFCYICPHPVPPGTWIHADFTMPDERGDGRVHPKGYTSRRIR